MRPIKMFGLAMVAAIAATAFVGAPSAMAEENTALCWAHEEPCAAENLVGTFTMLATNVVFLTNATNILAYTQK